VKTMKEQAEELGVTILDGDVVSVEKQENIFTVSTKTDKFTSKTLLIATGSERRKLGLKNEDELKGKGVHYCVTCDGPVYAGKTVAIVGGGNAAVKGAALAAEYASKVYLVVMESEFMAEPVSVDALKMLGDKVEIIFDTEVKEIIGKDKIESVVLHRRSNLHSEGGLSPDAPLKVDGLFIEIGSVPANGLVGQLGVSLDNKGYIVTDADVKTNISGVFAAGDISNLFGFFKQNITAAATGAVAANSAYQYLKNKR